MTKPIVHYTGSLTLCGEDRYLVQPTNHPDTNNVSNRRVAMTSRIVRYVDDEGTFETENSIYKKVDHDSEKS